MYGKRLNYIDVGGFYFDYVQNAQRLYDYCPKFGGEKSKAYSRVIYEFTNELVEFKEKLAGANAHYRVAAADYHYENDLHYAQQRNKLWIINLMIFLALELVILSALICYLYERKRRIRKWRKVLQKLTIRPRFIKS